MEKVAPLNKEGSSAPLKSGRGTPSEKKDSPPEKGDTSQKRGRKPRAKSPSPDPSPSPDTPQLSAKERRKEARSEKPPKDKDPAAPAPVPSVVTTQAGTVHHNAVNYQYQVPKNAPPHVAKHATKYGLVVHKEATGPENHPLAAIDRRAALVYGLDYISTKHPGAHIWDKYGSDRTLGVVNTLNQGVPQEAQLLCTVTGEARQEEDISRRHTPGATADLPPELVPDALLLVNVYHDGNEPVTPASLAASLQRLSPGGFALLIQHTFPEALAATGEGAYIRVILDGQKLVAYKPSPADPAYYHVPCDFLLINGSEAGVTWTRLRTFGDLGVWLVEKTPVTLTPTPKWLEKPRTRFQELDLPDQSHWLTSIYTWALPPPARWLLPKLPQVRMYAGVVSTDMVRLVRDSAEAVRINGFVYRTLVVEAAKQFRRQPSYELLEACFPDELDQMVTNTVLAVMVDQAARATHVRAINAYHGKNLLERNADLTRMGNPDSGNWTTIAVVGGVLLAAYLAGRWGRAAASFAGPILFPEAPEWLTTGILSPLVEELARGAVLMAAPTTGTVLSVIGFPCLDAYADYLDLGLSSLNPSTFLPRLAYRVIIHASLTELSRSQGVVLATGAHSLANLLGGVAAAGPWRRAPVALVGVAALFLVGYHVAPSRGAPSKADGFQDAHEEYIQTFIEPPLDLVPPMEDPTVGVAPLTRRAVYNCSQPRTRVDPPLHPRADLMVPSEGGKTKEERTTLAVLAIKSWQKDPLAFMERGRHYHLGPVWNAPITVPEANQNQTANMVLNRLAKAPKVLLAWLAERLPGDKIPDYPAWAEWGTEWCVILDDNLSRFGVDRSPIVYNKELVEGWLDGLPSDKRRRAEGAWAAWAHNRPTKVGTVEVWVKKEKLAKRNEAGALDIVPRPIAAVAPEFQVGYQPEIQEATRRAKQAFPPSLDRPPTAILTVYGAKLPVWAIFAPGASDLQLSEMVSKFVAGPDALVVYTAGDDSLQMLKINGQIWWEAGDATMFDRSQGKDALAHERTMAWILGVSDLALDKISESQRANYLIKPTTAAGKHLALIMRRNEDEFRNTGGPNTTFGNTMVQMSAIIRTATLCRGPEDLDKMAVHMADLGITYKSQVEKGPDGVERVTFLKRSYCRSLEDPAVYLMHPLPTILAKLGITLQYLPELYKLRKASRSFTEEDRFNLAAMMHRANQAKSMATTWLCPLVQTYVQRTIEEVRPTADLAPEPWKVPAADWENPFMDGLKEDYTIDPEAWLNKTAAYYDVPAEWLTEIIEMYRKSDMDSFFMHPAFEKLLRKDYG